MIATNGALYKHESQRYHAVRQLANGRPEFREGLILKEFDKHGNVVGRFRYVRLLGRGGFAKCYEMEHDGKLYALKVIDRSILQKTKTLQKLHSEISIHRRMKHKNIVNFIRTFQDEWNVYMLLELCSNQTLMEISKRRSHFSVPETQHIMLQSLSAVQYMHDQCVIHRDLKLGNIMLDVDMNIKIGDFGLATELHYDGERKRTICGTPNYIAPEIIDGAHEGHSYEVDIWSLGVILYTLLVGEPPFQTSDVKTTYRRIKQCRYEFPPRVDIPESGKELIHRILQSRPDHRPTLVEIRSHLFFRSPTPPFAAPISLFPAPPHRTETECTQHRQPQHRQHVRRGSDPVVCALSSVPAPIPTTQPRREVLQPISVNAITSGDCPPQSEKLPQTMFYGAKPINMCVQKNIQQGIGSSVDIVRPLQSALRRDDRRVGVPNITPCVLDEEEKNHLTVIHDHLHQTLLEGRCGNPPPPPPPPPPIPSSSSSLGVNKHTTTAKFSTSNGVELMMMADEEKKDEDDEKEKENKFLLPPVWVTDYADFSSKYGLCYKLNIGHTGVHFNDSTKMIWDSMTNHVEYYARVKEIVTRNNTNIIHARDQRQTFYMENYPENLNKKVTLIKYFKSYLARGRHGREGVEVVHCSPYMEQTSITFNEPHINENIVYVKRWLLTSQAMIFRLSNKTIQVCFHDKAEVILSSESRVVTYTDATGRRVTMALSSVASHSKEIAARLRYTKDILCELIQNREL